MTDKQCERLLAVSKATIINCDDVEKMVSSFASSIIETHIIISCDLQNSASLIFQIITDIFPSYFHLLHIYIMMQRNIGYFMIICIRGIRRRIGPSVNEWREIPAPAEGNLAQVILRNNISSGKNNITSFHFLRGYQ
jgi:hypothetical protein